MLCKNQQQCVGCSEKG